jgi:hypothetical protein
MPRSGFELRIPDSGFELFMAVKNQIEFSWVVTPCRVALWEDTDVSEVLAVLKMVSHNTTRRHNPEEELDLKYEP